MKDVILGMGLVILLLIIASTTRNPKSITNTVSQDESGAVSRSGPRESLPATGECVTNDMRVVDCSASDAAMTMENFKSEMKSLCNSLDNTRISEMTSKELRIQGACRAVTAGHFFDR
jgi:hypothetical protein